MVHNLRNHQAGAPTGRSRRLHFRGRLADQRARVVAEIAELRRGIARGAPAGQGKSQINGGGHGQVDRAQLDPSLAVIAGVAVENTAPHATHPFQTQPGVRIVDGEIALRLRRVGSIGPVLEESAHHGRRGANGGVVGPRRQISSRHEGRRRPSIRKI